MIREVIVVEGKSDTAAIRRAVEADTIETNGSAIGEQVLKRIELAHQRRGIIVLTDPDHAGERIRKIVAARVPGCKHAFISLEEAQYGDDIGVENAPPEAIRRALSQLRTEAPGAEPEVFWSDVIAAGLTGRPDSGARRWRAGLALGIGYCNAKQFWKRCVMFNITRDEFAAAIVGLDSETTRTGDV